MVVGRIISRVTVSTAASVVTVHVDPQLRTCAHGFRFRFACRCPTAYASSRERCAVMAWGGAPPSDKNKITESTLAVDAPRPA